MLGPTSPLFPLRCRQRLITASSNLESSCLILLRRFSAHLLLLRARQPLHPSGQSAAWRCPRRVLVSGLFDFRIANAPVVVGYVVHDTLDVVATAPPCGLVCLRI
jgi:hypothetical protein